jgi:homocysteine S-methyltransferase
MCTDTLAGLSVLDGAMATELERRGADLDHPLWSARVLAGQPALIEAVHYDYFDAGADVAITASYQATLDGFARHGIDAARGRALLRLSVHLACDARDRFWCDAVARGGRRWPLVAASVGPYGAHLHDGSEYSGDYDVGTTALMDFHRRQLEVLADTPADLVAFETVPSRREAEAILRLLEEFPSLRAWVSFSCRNSTEVAHGEPFAECVALVADSAQVLATGLNCTAPRFVPSLLASAAPRAAKPLLVYPNSGERWQAGDNSWSGDADLDDIGADARRWRAAGARLVGGCCRTTPEHIRRIAAALHEG